ncbi:hypothetical protein LTR27_001736 [Elasticomyces elasticus]|nr:hypothetical protein LTR27_001736 [Elasticomyces elasticus]
MTRRPKPKDGTRRPVRQRNEMDGSSYTSKVDPALRNQKSHLRDILPELRLQHTISRRPYRTVKRRLSKARLAGENWVEFGSLKYHVDFVDGLLAQARVNLRNGRSIVVGQQPTGQPSVASNGDEDTHSDADGMEDAQESAHSFDKNAMASPAEDHEMVKGVKRKSRFQGMLWMAVLQLEQTSA